MQLEEIGLVAIGVNGPLHQRRNAWLVLLGKADVEIEPERLGKGFSKIGAEALARDATHHFAHQEAEAHGVVAVLFAGGPPGLLLGQRLGHDIPVVERAGRERLFDGDQPGAVREQVAHREFRFAPGLELGPVVRHRGIDIELAFFDKPQRAERCHPLRGGEDVDEAIALPGTRAGFVGVAGKQVDHGLAFERHADRGTQFVTARKRLLEFILHTAKTRDRNDREFRSNRPCACVSSFHGAIAGVNRSYPRAARTFRELEPQRGPKPTQLSRKKPNKDRGELAPKTRPRATHIGFTDGETRLWANTRGPTSIDRWLARTILAARRKPVRPGISNSRRSAGPAAMAKKARIRRAAPGGRKPP